MTAPDPAAAPPWTEAARARVALAYEAYELAELARAAVAVGPDELRGDGTSTAPGSALADAVRLVGAAHRLLTAAAVYERAAGADWRVVGAALNVSAGAARQRFVAAEARFRERPRSPGDESDAAVGKPDGWRSYLLREPMEAARDLDDWVLRHQDGDGDLGGAPVSGPLLRPAPRGHP